MKKQLLTLFSLTIALTALSQPVVETFETFSLSANSFYKDTNNTPFQTAQCLFTHEWTGGQYPYWSGGFSYTNVQDSANGTYTNLYGVMPLKGFSGSDKFVVGQDAGVIRTKNKSTAINGFYYTNTTYTYKSMRYGDAFARKFGDTTGTGSGTTIAQGAYPDFLKLLVYGYRNGVKIADSVEIFLADYRFASASDDYLVKDWRYANTSKLGLVDSIQFKMRGSVYNAFGLATPLFFGLDNVETGPANLVGLERVLIPDLRLYPVPVKDKLTIQLPGEFSLALRNAAGELLLTVLANDETIADLQALSPGLYFLEILSSEQQLVRKLIKE